MTSGYMVFAVAQFEEPALVMEIGPKYVEYMKTTPRYIPNFRSFLIAKKD